jgi:hypothetical protein
MNAPFVGAELVYVVGRALARGACLSEDKP